MSAFLDDFLQEDTLLALVGSRARFALFGKHPGWDDFVTLALEGRSLAVAKTLLFTEGIGSQTGSDLYPNQERIDFDHVFLWQKAKQFIIGLIWQSQDSKGRSKYPMIFCVHCIGVAQPWALHTLLPKMEQVRQGCIATSSSEEVRSVFLRLKGEMRELVATAPTGVAQLDHRHAERARFISRSEWGMERGKLTGLLDVLAGMAFGPVNQGALFRMAGRHLVDRKAEVGPRAQALQIRVPPCGGSAAEVLTQWSDFLGYLLGWRLPALFVFPRQKNWLDIVVGEPAPSQFTFLRAPLGMIPLESDKTRPLNAAFKAAAEQLLAEYLNPQSSRQRPNRKIARLALLVLGPLVAGAVLAAYLRISPPEAIPGFLRDLARVLGNPHLQFAP